MTATTMVREDPDEQPQPRVEPEPPFEFQESNPWAWKTRCRPRTKPEEPHQWTQSETLALARQLCLTCNGLGVIAGTLSEKSVQPCHCVLRAIFSACLEQFRNCLDKDKHISHVNFEPMRGPVGKLCWSRKNEEFVADFCLVSRRHLSPARYLIFRRHFLLGHDWRDCCRALNMDRGDFFHEVYRIKRHLGRVYRELKPYALYPASEYFN